MTTLVIGASGATGKPLVEQLLSMGQKVKLIVRATGKITDTWKNNEKCMINSFMFIKKGLSTTRI